MGCAASTPESKRNAEIEKKIREDGKKLHSVIKILLLGPGESGKSTIFKQMKIIQDDGGYSKDELLEYKYIIFGNCITQMRTVVHCAKSRNLTVANPENLARFNRLAESPAAGAGDAWSIDMAKDIKALWADSGIRTAFSLCDKEFQLDDCAEYFFSHLDRFMADGFVPVQDDVLRVRVRTTGIQEAQFKFEDIKIAMLDVGGQRSERRKWIHCFDQVTIVLFCVALSEYDQTLREDPTQNRMKESLLLFDEVCNSTWFANTAFILFLNKLDLFEEKIQRVDLASCFPTYTGGRNAQAAVKFIEQNFLQRNKSKRDVFSHPTVAISTENIEYVFKRVRETVLNAILQTLIVF